MFDNALGKSCIHLSYTKGLALQCFSLNYLAFCDYFPSLEIKPLNQCQEGQNTFSNQTGTYCTQLENESCRPLLIERCVDHGVDSHANMEKSG